MTTKQEKRNFLKKQSNEREPFFSNSPEAKKSLGQNFLKEEKFLDLIVDTAKIDKKETILEIGPGTGLLTDKILSFSKNVFCIEKDRRMIQYLADKYKGESCFPIVSEDDILKVNLPLFLEENKIKEYKVVANIPYYITGKLIRLFLETKIRPNSLTLLVQKEIAKRICSKAASMSILSISVQYFGDVKIIKEVSKEAFSPVPKVDSAIIHIVPFKGNRETLVLEKRFFQVVKNGFSNPRKKLLNNLVAGLELNKDNLKEIFKKLDLEENVRAQELSVGKWKILRDETIDSF